jgi:YfiH family protein
VASASRGGLAVTPGVDDRAGSSAQATPAVAGGFEWRAAAGGRVLVSPALALVAPHVFTTRPLVFRGDREAADYDALARHFETDAARVIRVSQVHGRTVIVVKPGEPIGTPEADAIVSVDPARVIAVRVADCVPLLLADRTGRVVTAVHAGWRGTCAGVATAAVEAIAELGVAPADLIAAVGPSIGPCCYQVNERVRSSFLAMTPDAAAWFVEDGPGHWRLDLWRANADQLEAAGVPPAAIHIARLCTADDLGSFYSYRKEGAGTGRLIAAIGLRQRSEL